MKKRAKTKAKEHVVVRSQHAIVGRELDLLLSLCSGAMALNDFLRKNCGHCNEWPIQIIASTAKDAKEARELCSLLVDLAFRVRRVKRSGPAFRALMGWQAKALNGEA